MIIGKMDYIIDPYLIPFQRSILIELKKVYNINAIITFHYPHKDNPNGRVSLKVGETNFSIEKRLNYDEIPCFYVEHQDKDLLRRSKFCKTDREVIDFIIDESMTKL
jgi:hypothetical protein